MSFSEFESLAQCHGVNIQSFQIDQGKTDEDFNIFRTWVDNTCSTSVAESFIIVNFSRKHLGQTGNGHFSPIGGYHKNLDLVLVLDVARFKYPPFWVPLRRLWEAMTIHDHDSGAARGYFVVSCNENLRRERDGALVQGDIKRESEANKADGGDDHHDHHHHHHGQPCPLHKLPS